MHAYKVNHVRVELTDCTFDTHEPIEYVAVLANFAMQMYAIRRRVQAIKHVREALGIGLKEAKQFCDEAWSFPEIGVSEHRGEL